jgi:flagellar motor switch protein FliG
MMLVPAFAGQREEGRASGGAAPRAQQARKQADNHPGEQLLGRLSRMTPEEREQALAAFPPARRAQIEQRIRNFEKLPPAAQMRTLDRLERLNSLPPQRQNEVRRSMKELQQLPPERKAAIQQEMRRLTLMPNERRQVRMSSEDFRGRYSPEEQQTIGNLAEILPSRD